MSDLARIERLLNLLYTIHKSPGIQAKELASIFERTIRTIQRDICDLRKMGFEIVSSTGAAGKFASRGAYLLRPLVFSGAEALAVFVAAQVLLEQKGFPYSDDLRSALDKISNVILEKDESFFQILEPKTSVLMKQMKDYYPWGNVFTEINRAIIEQITVEITYDSYSSHNVSKRRVNPYHMMFREGCWYLIGYCYHREEIRIFRIDRIIGLVLTEEKFNTPADFSIGRYLQNSWQLGKGEPIAVKVRFDPPVSRLIRENTWHPTQQIEELSGDSLIYTVCVEGIWEIKKWILGWGAGAVCLEPEGLRKEIGREIHKLVICYKE